ncbi:hypothetical protein C1N76_10020 [Geobacillus thermoleovorans]|uniref:Uncharacterized protein n=1 Tax=Geobacillus thermoleovorans TaxID=33941 RepID=A0A2Z3NAT7_GEOTH|nr:hypothetical protein C1N76_10020 [Geobacillus thermoleovorans]
MVNQHACKIMIFIYCICLFLMVGCEKWKETVSRNDTKLKVNPAFVALADGDRKLIFLDCR